MTLSSNGNYTRRVGSLVVPSPARSGMVHSNRVLGFTFEHRSGSVFHPIHPRFIFKHLSLFFCIFIPLKPGQGKLVGAGQGKPDCQRIRAGFNWGRLLLDPTRFPFLSVPPSQFSSDYFCVP